VIGMTEDKIKGLDKMAARIAAQNIADWFDVISADELADYLIGNVDVAAMLPMVLTIPTIFYRVARFSFPSYLKNILRDWPRKAKLYEEIRRTLANPDIFGKRYHDHCLLLGWGLYTDPEMRSRQLTRFPCLAAMSSAQGWYHANMDRVVKRLITQLEGGVAQHDIGITDRPDSAGSGHRTGGPGTVGVLPIQTRDGNIDLSAAVPDKFPGSATDLDQFGCDVVEFGGPEPG